MFLGSTGFVFDTPGTTDIGVPGFSSNAATAAIIGQPEARIGTAAETPYNLQQEELDTQLQGDIQRINLYATGNYQLTPEHSVYVESSYSQRQNTDIFTSEQVFPVVPAQIPQEDANGNIVVDATGAPILVDNPLSPFDDEDALPVYSLQGLSQRRRTDIDNFRVVLGIEGEVGFGFFRDNGWVYDVFVSAEEAPEPRCRRACSSRTYASRSIRCG